MQGKQKILCLHGFRQHSEKFRVQTGGLRKLVKAHADFTFISAPHLLKGVEEEQRGWWFSKPDSYSSKDETDIDDGFEESLNLIINTFKTQGPFDGLLGFSQGAALTAILSSLQQKKELDTDFKFVILVSGFKSKCSKHSKYYLEKISLPSLHVIGENDNIVECKRSEELADIFVNPIIIKHGGGHHVPSSSLLKQDFKDFLNSQQKIPSS